jgi:hypothetical protein
VGVPISPPSVFRILFSALEESAHLARDTITGALTSQNRVSTIFKFQPQWRNRETSGYIMSRNRDNMPEGKIFEGGFNEKEI